MAIRGVLSLDGLGFDLGRWGSLPNFMQVVQQNVGNWGYIAPERSFEYGFGLPEHGEPVVWNSVEELPRDVQYDFIIIGGKSFDSLQAFTLKSSISFCNAFSV